MKEEDLIFYAFRYCLGRKTYASEMMVKHLIKNWKQLTGDTQWQIQKEINTAIHNGDAGAEMDVKGWKKILELKIK